MRRTISVSRTSQLVLLCACGAAGTRARGMCSSCYFAWRHDQQFFDGLRQEALLRDARRCTVCGSAAGIVVHHRRAGINRQRLLVTLCRGCHVRVHHLKRAYFGMSLQLQTLWQEQHPRQAKQLELQLSVPPMAEFVQRDLWELQLSA